MYKSASGGGEIVTARNVADWEADCIICGLSTFDADHILLLGYAPPEEEDIGVDLCLSWFNFHQSNPQNDHHDNEPIKVTATQPEMQVVVRATGEVIS